MSIYIDKQKILTDGDMQIGGTNVLRNTDPTTDLITGTISGTNWVCASSGTGKGSIINLDKSFSAKHGFRISDNTGHRDFNQRPAKWGNYTYTFSIYARLADNTVNASALYIRSWSNAKGSSVFDQSSEVTSTNWKKFKFIIDASTFYDDDTASFAFGINGKGSMDFAEPKLEKGTVATDWSPAPEDILDRLTALENRVGGGK